MRIRIDELKAGVSFFGPTDHLFRKIEPHAFGRLQCGEKASVSAAQLKNSQIGVHIKAVDFSEAVVIPFAQALPGIAFAGNPIPMLDTGLLIYLTGWVE